MMTALHILVGLVGLSVIARTVLSAVRTFVVPRGDNDAISRLVFRVLLKVMGGANMDASQPSLFSHRRA